jgi:hypothetical protein
MSSDKKKTREIVRGVRKVSKKDTEEERSRRICQTLNDSTISVLSKSKCDGVSDMNNNWFEARCACIYQYLLQIMPVVYTPYLIVPIILSFSNNDKKGTEFVDDVLYNCYKNIELEKDEQYQEIGRNLIFCNKQWNESLGNKNKVKDSLHIEQVLSNPKFNQTLINTQFLEEILGVINKKGYIEKTDKYILNAYVKEINKEFDTCKQLKQEDCQINENCILRFTSTGGKDCTNRQRYRNGIIPKDPTSYYLFENPFEQDGLIVFKPLSKKYIISGYSGIFRQYDVVKKGKDTGKEKDTDRYTITFPPFGGGAGVIIRGIKTFITSGYIKDYQTRDGETVGIHEGFYNNIQDWFVNEFLPLEIDKESSHIYIVGCSLGAALTNVASYFLMNEGYKHIHFYAHGSPRVGDERLRKYMENAPFGDDSYNYVRINNVVNMRKFYTEFDPVCKFPVKHETCYMPGRCLQFANNSRLRGFAGGIIFGIEMLGFEKQKDFNMATSGIYEFFNSKNEDIVHSRECLFEWIHSVGAYSPNTINGELTGQGDTNKYKNQFDAIRNIDFDEECGDIGDIVRELNGKNKKSFISST